jgi:hypothetical protein
VVSSARYISGEDRSGIDFNQSLDEYLQTQAEENNAQFADLSEQQREEFLRGARQEFFDRFDIEIAADRPLSEILAEIAVNRIREAAQNYQPLFPLIFTLIILALLRTFAFIFRWIAIALTWAFFRMLLALKFFRITKAQVEVQRLEI